MNMDTFLSLLAVHFTCSDVSGTRQMTAGEIAMCSNVYTEVKLAFVEDMDADTFRSLPIDERAEINKRAYMAYYRWKQAHPDLVRHVRSVARGEAELAVAS